MVWLSNSVNFSTSTGHDSLNRLACEYKRSPKAAIIKKVRNKVIPMATILFIFNRTKEFTTGWRTMAIMIANTIGTIMLRAMYNNVNKANKLMKKNCLCVKW